MGDLIVILESNNIRISKKGNICLNDLVNNILESKNPENYMKKIKSKFEHNNKYYVSQETCLEILEQGKSRTCKKIVKEITTDLNDTESIIDVKNNVFKYEGNVFTSFFIRDDEKLTIWLKAKEVASYLEYNNTRDAIINHIDDENKILYKKLLKFIPDNSKKNLDNKTVFINYSGLLQFVCRSKQSKSIEFANFLNIPIFHKKIYHEQDIINKLSKFFKTSKINYNTQYKVKYGLHKYRIDCYLSDYKIAIEIDENDHSDRDPDYEIKREFRIKKKLQCQFLRCNPDDPNFSLFEFIGLISRKLIKQGEK